jgi:phosphoribosylaminoimidazole-succinocarboxamide synthase
VVTGSISGSGYNDYLDSGSLREIPLPPGLSDGDKLPEPIFTPAFKAELGDHDENISFEKVTELVGVETAIKLRELSISIYESASLIATKAGLILADTKFEFGLDPTSNQMVLGDEVLTPDSSRYWDKAAYDSGNRNQSFDKQIVRNWLLENWDPDSGSTPPVLTPEVVALTSSRYAELREKLVATSK